MKVFVAGASGALGRRLVPLLVAAGHDVVAMTRSPQKTAALRELGAEPVVADGLDRNAIIDVVATAEPDVVIHQMTGLAGVTSLRNPDGEFVLTNRLRTDGTDYLLEAASVAGVGRMIAQSYGLWDYGDTSGRLHTENEPLDPSPPATMTQTLEAIRHVESVVPAADGLEGLVLRYGFFYGPGTGIAVDGGLAELVRNRKWPVIGDGAGVWSFVHVDDAAAATVAAVDAGSPGVYNVVDDEPARLAAWLPELANVLGAKPPRHVPDWVGRVAAGDAGVYLSTRLSGLSNAKAKRELGWEPLYATWRRGFRQGLAEMPAAPRHYDVAAAAVLG